MLVLKITSSLKVVTPAMFILSNSVCPSTSKSLLANIFPVNVVIPVELICNLAVLLVAT